MVISQRTHGTTINFSCTMLFYMSTYAILMLLLPSCCSYGCVFWFDKSKILCTICDGMTLMMCKIERNSAPFPLQQEYCWLQLDNNNDSKWTIMSKEKVILPNFKCSGVAGPRNCHNVAAALGACVIVKQATIAATVTATFNSLARTPVVTLLRGCCCDFFPCFLLVAPPLRVDSFGCGVFVWMF
jgi:hypothetical protein